MLSNYLPTRNVLLRQQIRDRLGYILKANYIWSFLHVTNSLCDLHNFGGSEYLSSGERENKNSFGFEEKIESPV